MNEPDVIVETPTEPAPPETPESTPDDSLAAHEAALAARQSPPAETDDDEPSERDEKGRFKHRAQSQKATADDVAEIHALTKELRTKEAQLAKVKPDAVSGSPRLLTLRRQIKAIEAELSSLKPAEPVQAPRQSPQAPTAPFAEPEPTLEQFYEEPDPHVAWMKAWNRWDRQREAHEYAIASQANAQSEAVKATLDAHNARLNAFASATPDFATVTQGLMNQPLPEIMLAAIARDDKGPQFVYYLAQHPEVVDDLILATDQKPVTDASVAAVQRRLRQHVQAVGTTGSAASARPTYVPPRPPNPVRTGPIRTGDDLPGEDASLLEHERAYSRVRR